MKIRLHEIPTEGKAFLWNRETAEINQVLFDLIGEAPYTAEFFIKPLNKRDFEMTGSVKTQVPDLCSRCGIDFKFPVNVKIREILIPYQPDDRTSKYSRVNHLSESEEGGPSVVEYDSDETFAMGEYLHEQIAIAVPFNPAPPVKEDGDCSLCERPVVGVSFNYEEELPEERPESPFSALKNLKI